MKCQVCDKGEAFEGESCSYCGAIVRSLLGRGAPLPPEVVAEAEERRRALKLRHEASVQERAKKHAVIGVIIFALGGCGLFGAVLCNLAMHHIIEKPAMAEVEAHSLAAAEADASGAPVPVSVVIGVLLAFPLAAALGAPAGYVVSRLQRGPGFGVLVGACAFSLGAVLVNLGSILGSARPWLELVFCAGIGTLPGTSVGYLLGCHVSLEGV